MSNASLKEQLQALSGNTNPPAQPEKNKAAPKNKNMNTRVEKNPKQKPAWLEHAQYGVELLKAHFPNCFRSINEIKPLKIGIKQDLVKLLSTKEDIVIGDKACMVSSLSYYVNSPNYHRAVIEGAERIDLEGQPSGTVNAEEAKYSLEHRHSKNQKKKAPVKVEPATVNS